MLSREEEDEAARAAVRGSRAARRKLVNANLRFVVQVAKNYQGQGIPLPDLISEGNIGLLNAAKRFDADKGCRFISYAVWWIRQAILRAVCEKSRMIRLPLNRAYELVRIEKARKFTECGSAGQENREIARFLNMKSARVEELVGINRDLASLDAPVSAGGEGTPLGDLLEDRRCEAPEEAAVEAALRDDIETVLGTLDRKEAAVIRFRYGLGGRIPLSLQEISERFHLTKERIRQIERSALKRLRHPKRLRILQSYVA
ncbi:MAG: RNA polymerase sigma factor RpoD [Treponematales bacterium]